MIRISIPFFYGLGASMRQIAGLQSGSKLIDIWGHALDAQNQLNQLFGADWFFPAVRSAWAPGQKLITGLKTLTDRTDWEEPVSPLEAYNVSSALTDFETTLRNELAIADAYFVSRKAAYDTGTLIANAEKIFPQDLPIKVPLCVADVREAGKCLAFELSTAAGFHIFRALEMVVRSYWGVVGSGLSPAKKAHPKNKNLGAYLTKMKDNDVGNKKVRAILDQIRELHRNPLIHPEEIVSLDEAVGLFGICQSAVTAMLKEIPVPVPATVSSASP